MYRPIPFGIQTIPKAHSDHEALILQVIAYNYLGTLDLAVDTGARVTVVFPGTLVCKHPVGEDTRLGLGEQVSGHCKGERYRLRFIRLQAMHFKGRK